MTWLPAPKWAVAVLASVVIITIVVGTFFVLSELRRDALARVRAEVRGLSEVLAEQSSRAFEGAELALLAAQYRLSDSIGQQLGLESFPVSALLGARTAGLPQIRSMFVIDPAGQTVNTSLPSGPPVGSLADRDYFRYFQHGGQDVFISDPVRSRADGEWTLIIAARLVDEQGDFRGVLAVSLAVAYFDSFYQGLESVDRFRIMLVKADSRQVLASPADRAQVGTVVEGVPTGWDARARPGVHESVEQHASGLRFITYKPVPGYPFLIGVMVDEDLALREWPQTVGPIASFAVAVVLFILVATAGLMWSLHRRELMARALHESDARGRQLIQTVNDGIVMLDQCLSIVLFNPAAEALFGRPAATVIGTPLRTYWSRPFVTSVSASWGVVAKRGAACRPALARPRSPACTRRGRLLPPTPVSRQPCFAASASSASCCATSAPGAGSRPTCARAMSACRLYRQRCSVHAKRSVR
ncbi:cache domain-containing protein [Thauera mechernichensis]